jgi:hypothetical protein
MFGMPHVPLGFLGIAGGTDWRPTDTIADGNALQKRFLEAQAHNRTPNGHVARSFNMFGPQASQPQAPMLATPPMPAPVDMGQFKPPVVASDEAQDPGALSPNYAGPHSVGGAPVNPGAPMQANAPSPLDTAQWPAGPVGAPQDQGFFANNAAMMRDPLSGSFLDPTAASGAQASGPDVINKLMSYFHKKDTA